MTHLESMSVRFHSIQKFQYKQLSITMPYHQCIFDFYCYFFEIFSYDSISFPHSILLSSQNKPSFFQIMHLKNPSLDSYPFANFFLNKLNQILQRIGSMLKGYCCYVDIWQKVSSKCPYRHSLQVLFFRLDESSRKQSNQRLYLHRNIIVVFAASPKISITQFTSSFLSKVKLNINKDNLSISSFLKKSSDQSKTNILALISSLYNQAKGMHQLSILSKQFCFIATNHKISMKGNIPSEYNHNFTISTVSTSVLSNSSYLDKKQSPTYLNNNLIEETRINALDKSRNRWNKIPFRKSVQYQKSPNSPSTKYKLQTFLRNTSYFSVEENQPKLTPIRQFRADYQQIPEKAITSNRKTGYQMENKGNTYEKLFERINKKQRLINELKELSKGSITERLKTTQNQIKSPIHTYNYLNKPNKCTGQHERGYQSQPSKNKYQDNSWFKRKKFDFHRSDAYTITKAQSPLKACIRQKIKTQILQESYHNDKNHHYKKNPQFESKDQLFRKYKQSPKRVPIQQFTIQPTPLKLVFTKTQSAVQNQKQKFYSQRYTYQPQNFAAPLTSRNDNSKNIYDIRQFSDTKRIKNNANYFYNKKVQISDFYLLKTLGEGKFGTVHQAIHKATKSIFAIKKIPKKIIKQNLMIEQLIKQIKLQSLCRHQNILQLYGFFDDKDFIYLVLQYMSSGTLFHVLKKNRKLTEEEASIKLRHTAKAITYMHEKGIAHRDVKPQNIVIQSGIGKICDFGWATFCDAHRRKTYCGTFDYAAPQILQGSQYGISVDLWCLGILAYELLTGKAPFYHISRRQTMKKIMNVQNQTISFPSHLSKDAISFISNLLKKDPEQRMSGSNLLSHPFLLQKKQHP